MASAAILVFGNGYLICIEKRPIQKVCMKQKIWIISQGELYCKMQFRGI